jgi:hypothetical protein
MGLKGSEVGVNLFDWENELKRGNPVETSDAKQAFGLTATLFCEQRRPSVHPKDKKRS